MKLASITAVVVMLVSACGKKEEAPVAAKVETSKGVEVVCSYAPSQNRVISHISAVAGGSAAAASSIAQAAGLTAVLHSSGAYIFTGTSGYVAGTLGGAAALPAVVTVGVVVGTGAATLELVCASRNHPELVARVEIAAKDFLDRSKTSIGSATGATVASVGPLVADAKSVAVKLSNDAFEYAGRASVQVSQVLRPR